MKTLRDSGLNFTDQGWDALYNTVDDSQFYGHEAELIYRTLTQTLHPIPFGDYLKRFLYENANLSGDYRLIPQEEYQGILRAAFRDNRTPASFEPSSTRLSAASANWLSRKRVSRDTVLLLGFGLGLSISEVNRFLTKGLGQDALRLSLPRELICSYCYDHGFTFPKYEKLWEHYTKYGTAAPETESDTGLWTALQQLPPESSSGSGEASRLQESFRRLYHRLRTLLAAGLKGEESAPAESITPADVEMALYDGVPRDEGLNLLSMRQSTLYESFGDSRLSRKRIYALLQREVSVARSDLTLLNFYIWSCQKTSSPMRRYGNFVDDTNRILRENGFGELYAALPFDCFLMMCQLAEDPLGVYSDVWERSYQAFFESASAEDACRLQP